MFKINSNVPCRFIEFNYKEGDKEGRPWRRLQACFVTKDEEWLNHAFFEPMKDSAFKTVDQLKQTTFNKVSHICKTLGIEEKEISTYKDFKEWAELIIEKTKDKRRTDVYIKTIPGYKEGEVELSPWFPFVSLEPNLDYSEKDLEKIKSKGVTIDDVGDALDEEADDITEESLFGEEGDLGLPF